MPSGARMRKSNKERELGGSKTKNGGDNQKHSGMGTGYRA